LSARARGVLGLVVSVVLVGLLLRFVRPAEVLSALRGADVALLVAAVLVHGLMLLLRVQRFAGLIGEPGWASRAAFDSVFVGWLFNLTLPAKAGELARPLTYRAWSGSGLPAVVAAMVVERGLDLLVLGVLFVGALLLGLPPALPAWVATAAWVGVALGAVVLVGVGVLRRSSLGGVGVLSMAMSTSSLIWALEVVGVWLTLLALGVSVDGAWAASAVLVVASTLAVAAPAAPGGLGVEQWVTVLVLAAWGASEADAVAASLLVLFEAVVWIAPVGLLVLGRRSLRLGSLPDPQVDESSLAE